MRRYYQLLLLIAVIIIYPIPTQPADEEFLSKEEVINNIYDFEKLMNSPGNVSFENSKKFFGLESDFETQFTYMYCAQKGFPCDVNKCPVDVKNSDFFRFLRSSDSPLFSGARIKNSKIKIYIYDNFEIQMSQNDSFVDVQTLIYIDKFRIIPTTFSMTTLRSEIASGAMQNILIDGKDYYDWMMEYAKKKGFKIPQCAQ